MQAVPVEFPKFKKLELSDRELIESYTRQYPPYSDFNFTSLWSWDTSDRFQISCLNDNLVVQFTDYISDQPFISFIGSSKINDTTRRVLNLCQQWGMPPVIKLLPEPTAKLISNESFQLTEDRDNFDYIYELEDLLGLRGRLYETQRNQISRFRRHYERIETVFYRALSEIEAEDILELFQTWEANKEEELPRERFALRRSLFVSQEKSNLLSVGIKVDSKLIAFANAEITDSKYAIAHFAKADTQYPGIYSTLMHTLANTLFEAGVKYLNYEQDIGIPALRRAKNAFRPAFFLKKYKVENS